MNRKRVIFVKNINNDIVNGKINNLSEQYPNVIFFTQDPENQQIWSDGKKCSGITRINKNQNISIYNYQYSNINHYIYNSRQSFVPHDIYISNYKIVLNYNSPIDDIVQNTQFEAIIEGNIQNIKSIQWSIENTGLFTLSSPTSIQTEILYDKSSVYTGITKLSATITDKYDVNHYIYANIIISAGEIVPYSSLSLDLSIKKTHINVDESISIMPILTYSTLEYHNILPTLHILDEHWEISNPNVVSISADNVITGIYSPELEESTNKCVNVDLKYILTVEGYYPIESSITISVYKKYIYFESNFDDLTVHNKSGDISMGANSKQDESSTTNNSQSSEIEILEENND